MSPKTMSLVFNKASLVWLVLIVATAISWVIGTDSASQISYGPKTAQVLILLIAFIKIRLVLMYFMELNNAPKILKWTGEAWVVLMCSALIAVTFL